MLQEEDKIFHVLFRKPKYPMIIISKDYLMSAYNIDELAACCVSAELENDETFIKAIDLTAEEFLYSPQVYVISPGILSKRWTKKRIIDLYNSMTSDGEKYSEKSLSGKKLERIMLDICNLLK